MVKYAICDYLQGMSVAHESIAQDGQTQVHLFLPHHYFGGHLSFKILAHTFKVKFVVVVDVLRIECSLFVSLQAPAAEDKVNTHFVTFICKKGKLYEMSKFIYTSKFYNEVVFVNEQVL